MNSIPYNGHYKFAGQAVLTNTSSQAVSVTTTRGTTVSNTNLVSGQSQPTFTQSKLSLISRADTGKIKKKKL